MTRFFVRIILTTLLGIGLLSGLYFNDLNSFREQRYPFTRRLDSSILRPSGNIHLSVDVSNLIGFRNGLTFFLSKGYDGVVVVSPSHIGPLTIRPGDSLEKSRILFGKIAGDTLLLVQQHRISAISLVNGQVTTFPGPVQIMRASYSGNGNFILRYLPPGLHKNYSFGQYNPATNSLQEETAISERIDDGGLATDGVLLSSRDGNNYYIYNYNSTILRFGKGLKGATHFNTIDSTRQLPVIDYDSVRQAFNFFSPRRVVNHKAAINERFLVIHSFRRSNNEFVSVFKNHLVFDLYDRQSMTYRSSVYVRGDLNSLTDFALKGDSLVVLLDHHSLQTYQLSAP